MASSLRASDPEPRDRGRASTHQATGSPPARAATRAAGTRLRSVTGSAIPASDDQGCPKGEVLLEAVDIERRYGTKAALRGVSLTVHRGEIHALLGPNGAGKTTLLRVLTGLQDPSGGRVRLAGLTGALASREARQRIGLVPSGDRTFYNRISGRENLLFFCRLYGLRKRAAQHRAAELLEAVGLADAADRPVGMYSHGMQKRLGVARALMMSPDLLLVDEATHDLDPAAAQNVRNLVRAAADDGAAVVWTTQRVDEIRGFANRVTLLAEGEVCFVGSVPQLVARSMSRRFVLRLRRSSGEHPTVEELRTAVLGAAEVEAGEPGDLDHFLFALRPDVALGDVVVELAREGVVVVGCNEERPEVEVAVLALTGQG